MVSFKSLSALLLAGTTLAAPALHRRGEKKVVWHTVVKTAYVTVFPGMPQPTPESSEPAVPTTTVAVTPTPEPELEQPEPEPTPSSSTVIVVETPEPSSEVPVSTPMATPSSTQAAAPTSSQAASPTTSQAAAPSGTGYMAIVDEWRAKLGLEALTQDSKLEANAKDTVVTSNGKMVHKLNPGSYGQVLAPGSPDEFYSCFVGGWLCERPDMAGMNGVCNTASKGWSHTSTGHADILTSGSYSKIGCANYNGIWGCDLA